MHKMQGAFLAPESLFRESAVDRTGKQGYHTHENRICFAVLFSSSIRNPVRIRNSPAAVFGCKDTRCHCGVFSWEGVSEKAISQNTCRKTASSVPRRIELAYCKISIRGSPLASLFFVFLHFYHKFVCRLMDTASQTILKRSHGNGSGQSETAERFSL